MLASVYDRSRGVPPTGRIGIDLPEVDPTDGEGASVQNVAQPERRLLMAILSDAIVRFRRFASTPGHAQRGRSEAENWIRSNDRAWACSFVNVCEALDIAPDPLRRALLQWRRPEADERAKRVTRRTLLVKAKRRHLAAATAGARS